MNKVSLIIQREYLSRVKKKSFLYITFLVPLLIFGLYGLMIFMATKSFTNEGSVVHVYDESGVVAPQLESNSDIKYIINKSKNEADSLQQNLSSLSGKNYLVLIPKELGNRNNIQLISSEKTGFMLESKVQSDIQKAIRYHMFERSGLDLETINSINPSVNLSTKLITDSGDVEDSSSTAATILSMALAILIYITLIIYGGQVMRGVIEEKNNRIVEVIISSVKPFELMIGKIIGIGLVGLTQFLLWIVLSSTLMFVGSSLLIDKNQISTTMIEEAQNLSNQELVEDNPANQIFAAIDSLNLGEIAFYFLIFFFLGYLLYSALFAAIGSAVDNETESQQFIFPLTLPLLFAYMMSFSVTINDPHGSVSFWLSMFPLTSPITMTTRIPFGVPTWEIILSLVLLVGGFILTTWIASKIYRVGILMYGKKASFKEIIKWFNYKN